MKKHILFVGLNDQNTRKQEVTTEQAVSIISKICGDCTISNAVGCYTYSGETTPQQENTLRVEMLFKQDNEVKQMAQDIKLALNQETVGFEVTESNSMLI